MLGVTEEEDRSKVAESEENVDRWNKSCGRVHSDNQLGDKMD